MSDETTKKPDTSQESASATAVAEPPPSTAPDAAAPDPEFEALEDTGGSRGSLLERLEMPVEVRFGRLEWSLRRLLELRVGDAVPVGPDGEDTVRLFVQGRPFASGELVVVNGRFGFRVSEILRGEDSR